MEEFEYTAGGRRLTKHAARRVCLPIFAFLLIAIAGSGCTQPDIHQPSSDIVVAETVVATETVSPIPTATAIPTSLPTPTPLSERDYFLTAQPDVIKVVPKCQPENERIICYDNLLHISFAYPGSWGELGAGLSKGGYTGYSYGYQFFPADPYNPQAFAGGRSADSSAGRGRIYTDFLGFTDTSRQQCTTQVAHSLCRSVKPGVVVRVYFPIAAYHCRLPSGYHYEGSSLGAVFINLLEPSLINGFVFFRNVLDGVDLDEMFGAEIKCSAEGQQDFDARIEELIEQVRLGTASPEIMDKVNELYRLAESIEGIGVGE